MTSKLSKSIFDFDVYDNVRCFLRISSLDFVPIELACFLHLIIYLLQSAQNGRQ